VVRAAGQIPSRGVVGPSRAKVPDYVASPYGWGVGGPDWKVKEIPDRPESPEARHRCETHT